MTPPTNTVVVTGAGSGVGRAIVDRFASEGWQVALLGRRLETLQESIAHLPDESVGRCACFACDVSDAAAVDAVAGEVLKRFGPVSVVVNSAGVNVRARKLSELSHDDWHKVMATNLHGAFYCTQAFLPGMRQQGNGTIININSDVGRLAREVAGAAYTTSKFGLTGLTQTINIEERPHGIRACSIFPRDINTPLLDKRPQPPPVAVRANMVQPEDVAACAWLAASLPSRAIVEEIAVYSR